MASRSQAVMARSLGAGPALFSTWLLILLLALRVQRTLGVPLLPLPPSGSRALTLLFLTAWVVGAIAALFALPSAGRGPGLVTIGPFAYVRHPLYAISLFLIGLVTIVSSRSWIVAAVWPLAYLQAHLWVRIEERALEEAFGDAWRDYAARTPRFLPLGARRRRSPAGNR